MALIVTKFVLLLSVAATFAQGRFVISRPDASQKNHKVFANFEHPTSDFVPRSLKVDEGTFVKLLGQLDQQVSEEFDISPVIGYFPKDVENDEWDELEFINNYEESVNEDDIDAVFTLPDSGVSVAATFGKREFSFSKVLVIYKNGTKAFSKVRQSVKVNGKASSSVSGNLNTTVVDSTTASATFSANVSVSTKGKDVHSVVTGDTSAKSQAKSKLSKRRYLEDTTGSTTTKLQVSSLSEPLTLRTLAHSGSETFRLPFRTFFTLFGASLNVSSDYGVASGAKIGGEVTSHVAFASKNHSLTKSCVKVFVRSTTSTPTSPLSRDDDDDDNSADPEQDSENVSNDDNDDDDQVKAEASGVSQVALVKAKVHTWTKVVSASKSGVVLDIITCTKARSYGKGWEKGKLVVFSGTGQVAWEKVQVTVTGEELEKLSSGEYGIYHIQKQLESGNLYGVGNFIGS